MPKPRKFSGPQGRGECRRGEAGEKVVDASCDIYDDRGGADGIVAFSQWLSKAATWLKEEDSE